MSKKIVIPERWKWYRLPGHSRILCPFRPDRLEYLWIRAGANEMSEEWWIAIQETMRRYSDDIVWERSSGDNTPNYQYEQDHINRIIHYAMTREHSPLRRPPAMDFSHFV